MTNLSKLFSWELRQFDNARNPVSAPPSPDSPVTLAVESAQERAEAFLEFPLTFMDANGSIKPLFQGVNSNA